MNLRLLKRKYIQLIQAQKNEAEVDEIRDIFKDQGFTMSEVENKTRTISYHGTPVFKLIFNITRLADIEVLYPLERDDSADPIS